MPDKIVQICIQIQKKFWGLDVSACAMINYIGKMIYRGVAQLVARLLWEQDAAGSSPVTSTKKDGFLNRLFLMPKGSKPLKIGA